MNSGRNRVRWVRPPPVAVRAGAAGRRASDSAVATGAPVPSARTTDIELSPVGAIRSRTAAAPTACRVTPLQAKGSQARPLPLSTPKARECSTLSRRAGWSPNRPASDRREAGRAASANTSSPRRHTAVRPWKAGP